MNFTEIANIRLTSQQISSTKLKSVKEIVGWMGAIQAQDYAMAKWAIGIRFPDSTDKLVETAINNGEIIRTHLLRPTWHFVSADDIYWMIDLTAPQIKASLRSRHKELELSENIFMKPEPLTKEEALEKLARRYFSSCCPATLQDFAWWSGLSLIDARIALEMVKADLVSEMIDSQTYWLPAYDEFLISYKNRTASFLYVNDNKVISSNGIFRPVIVVNGQVAGIWKRTIKNDEVIVKSELFMLSHGTHH